MLMNKCCTWGDLKWTLSTTTVTQMLERLQWSKGQIAKTPFFYLDISLANPLYRILAGYFPDGEGYNLTSW